MNKNEKRSIKKYDALAQNYDSTFDGKFTAIFKKKLLEMCAVSDGNAVLDVGCGNGRPIKGKKSHSISALSSGLRLKADDLLDCWP